MYALFVVIVSEREKHTNRSSPKVSHTFSQRYVPRMPQKLEQGKVKLPKCRLTGRENGIVEVEKRWVYIK